MNNSIYKKGLVIFLVIAIIIMTAVGIKLKAKQDEIVVITSTGKVGEAQVTDKIESKNDKENKIIYVDIDGAIKNPGVYEFTEGDIVNDAILRAGGLIENASTKNINRARKLADGEKIYISQIGEESKELDSSDFTVENKKININQASEKTLMSLPGIGEVYAKRIVEYRNEKPFNNIEEIKNIKGIGDKVFESIKGLITVNW